MGMGIVIQGELEGKAAATQFPSRECEAVIIKAHKGNGAHIVYIGGEGLTLQAGTEDQTSGIALVAEAETPWIKVRNLNALWYICSDVAADLAYLAVK